MNPGSLSQEASAPGPKSFSAAVVLGASVLGGVLGAWVVLAASLPETGRAIEATARIRATSPSPPAIDHSAVDWSRVPREPDASPMSVAAYD